MNKVIRAEFGRTINAGLIIAIAGIIFSICFDSFNDLIAGLRNGQGYVGYFFSNAAFGGMCTKYMLPVFTALPFSVSLCQERNNKAVSYIVSREGKNRYIFAKFIVSAISGGFVAVCGTVLLFLMLAMRFPIAGDEFEGAVVSDYFHEWSAVYYPQLYILTLSILAFCRGVIWSSLALCVSLYTSDFMVVLLSPFLGSYVLVRIFQIIRVPDMVRPDMILIGQVVIKSSGLTLIIAIAISLTIVTLIGAFFVGKMKEGLKSGAIY